MSRMIEIDVDGVLLDLLGHLETFLRGEGIEFKKEDVVDYGFTIIDSKIRRRAFEIFKTEEFIGTIPFKDSLIELKYALERAYNAGFEVIFNSFVLTYPLIEVRGSFLEELIRYIGLPIRYWVDCPESSVSKRMLSSFACIEDCLGNLERSPAKHRCIIDAPYNRNIGDLADDKNVKRFTSVVEAIDFLIRES